ncbi:hypothetical protein [uncultured Algibacter sp.]|uniref:hypothetical protein n=1 Tax=uncultured Algibacter sp. TaxID=298659 RepID=UPI0026186647|nr:hypothetical protein [uncultured Algibacter sp.]
MKLVEILKQATHHPFKYLSHIIEYDVHHIQIHYSSGVQVLTWDKHIHKNILKHI